LFKLKKAKDFENGGSHGNQQRRRQKGEEGG
jgi:hypothetical protein